MDSGEKKTRKKKEPIANKVQRLADFCKKHPYFWFWGSGALKYNHSDLIRDGVVSNETDIEIVINELRQALNDYIAIYDSKHAGRLPNEDIELLKNVGVGRAFGEKPVLNSDEQIERLTQLFRKCNFLKVKSPVKLVDPTIEKQILDKKVEKFKRKLEYYQIKYRCFLDPHQGFIDSIYNIVNEIYSCNSYSMNEMAETYIDERIIYTTGLGNMYVGNDLVMEKYGKPELANKIEAMNFTPATFICLINAGIDNISDVLALDENQIRKKIRQGAAVFLEYSKNEWSPLRSEKFIEKYVQEVNEKKNKILGLGGAKFPGMHDSIDVIDDISPKILNYLKTIGIKTVEDALGCSEEDLSRIMEVFPGDCTKFVREICSAIKKFKCKNKLYSITDPIDMLGLEKKELSWLDYKGIKTLGDILKMSDEEIRYLFGPRVFNAKKLFFSTYHPINYSDKLYYYMTQTNSDIIKQFSKLSDEEFMELVERAEKSGNGAMSAPNNKTVEESPEEDR